MNTNYCKNYPSIQTICFCLYFYFYFKITLFINTYAIRCSLLVENIEYFKRDALKINEKIYIF